MLHLSCGRPFVTLIETGRFSATARRLAMAQPTVSQHLKVLRETGWIEGMTDGPATSYCLNEKAIAWFRTKVGDIF